MKKQEQNREVYGKVKKGKSLMELYMEKCKELEQAQQDIKELQRDACYLCVRQHNVHY